LDLQLPVQSLPITIKVVSLNPVHGEVDSMQHYVKIFEIKKTKQKQKQDFDL
jgi:hypothetical protein